MISEQQPQPTRHVEVLGRMGYVDAGLGSGRGTPLGIVREACNCLRMNYDNPRLLARLRGLDSRRDEDDDFRWDDDPYDLAPTPPLPLSPPQEAALASAIAEGLREQGCDNTLRAAQSWTARAGLDWAVVRAGLEGRGGHCDCEVLLNVGLAGS